MKSIRTMVLGIVGLFAACLAAGTAHAEVLCKTRAGKLSVRDACRSTETEVDASVFSGPPSYPPAFTRALDHADIPSVGWNHVAPVANVYVSEPGRYVIVATANVRAIGNFDFVQCELWIRGRSRGRSVSVVPGLWTGESIALSTVETFAAPGNVDLRCTDIEDAKNAMLTDIRMTAFRVAAAPAPGAIVINSYDLEATHCYSDSVKNLGPGTSPATTAYYPACNRTVDVPSLASGQTHQLTGGCGNFIVDPQGLLDQPRGNDDTHGDVCIF